MHTKNVPNDMFGLAFWRRSRSGRTRSLWVFVKFVHHRQYDGKECWLIRELIRGGVGPMHGKALREVIVPEYRWHPSMNLADDEYTEEINALILEAMRYERDALPPGSHWDLVRENKKAKANQISSLYASFGINYKKLIDNNREFRRKNIQIDTNSGSEIRLYASFDDVQTATAFIKQAFRMGLAQSATLEDVAAKTTKRIRKRKSKKEED